MEITAVVKIDLKGLKKFKHILDADMAGSGNGPVADAFKQWAARYRGFVQRRFNDYSKGSGDWPPLAESTIKARRGKGIKVAILRDTSTLFAALAPVFAGAPGALERRIPFGIRVGYGGPHGHPSGGRATIADIAKFHNDGAGNLPERKIIVPPAKWHLDRMAADMRRALLKLAGDI